MATEWIRVCLRGWRPNGTVPFAEFFTPLNLPDTDPFEKLGAEEGYRSTSLIILARLKLSDFYSADDPWAAMAEELRQRFDETANWLRNRPKAAFDKYEEDGIKVDLLIQAWIDDNQVDLSLPARLCATCGELGIGIVFVTNE